jgi:hypothetical protein
MSPYLKAFTGILKTQPKQIIGTPKYGVSPFFTFEFLIQLYSPVAVVQDDFPYSTL